MSSLDAVARHLNQDGAATDFSIHIEVFVLVLYKKYLIYQ